MILKSILCWLFRLKMVPLPISLFQTLENILLILGVNTVDSGSANFQCTSKQWSTLQVRLIRP